MFDLRAFTGSDMVACRVGLRRVANAAESVPEAADTVGDVCGKGPEAAAVTALARYTLRAAAMRERAPSRVLAVLNEAMLRQHPGRFCTVVYARFRRDGGGQHLTLASGGHPLPVLVRPDETPSSCVSWARPSACSPTRSSTTATTTW